MWIDTEIWVQPGISNICNVGFGMPIVSKVNVCTCMHVIVRECDSEEKWKMNINNGVSLHSNHSCLVLWIFFSVYGVIYTMLPPLLIFSISDLSIVGKSILNSEEFLLFP